MEYADLSKDLDWTDIVHKQKGEPMSRLIDLDDTRNCYVGMDGEYEQWNIDPNVLAEAQPEPCEDAVSRQAVSSWLKQYGQDVLHGKYKFSLMYIWKNLMDLPSTQPEIVRCKDCKWSDWYNSVDGNIYCYCMETGAAGRTADDYCSYAEKENR